MNTQGLPCDGWKPLRPKRATAEYISARDPNFAIDVVSHNEHGKQLRCWRR